MLLTMSRDVVPRRRLDDGLDFVSETLGSYAASESRTVDEVCRVIDEYEVLN